MIKHFIWFIETLFDFKNENASSQFYDCDICWSIEVYTRNTWPNQWVSIIK